MYNYYFVFLSILFLFLLCFVGSFCVFLAFSFASA